MRGAVVVTALLGGLTVTQDEQMLSRYRFNTMQAEHFFCSRCGVYTHHRRRSDPTQFSVNVACLGKSPFDFECVPVFEGTFHPSDTPGRDGEKVAGYLKYEASR